MNTDKKEEFYYLCVALPSSKFVPKLVLHLPQTSLTFQAPPRINITKLSNNPKQIFGSSNGSTQNRHYFQIRVNGSLSPTEERQLWLVNGVKNSPEKFTIGLRTLLRSIHDREKFFQRRKMIGNEKNGVLEIQVIPSCNQLNSEVIEKILEQDEPLKLGDIKGQTIPTEDSMTCNLDQNASTNDAWTKASQSRICSTITYSTVQTEKQISQQMRERSILKCRSILRPSPFIKDTQTIDEPQTLLKIKRIASNMGYILILSIQAILLIKLMSPSLKI